MATTDEQRGGEGSIRVVDIAALEVGSVVRMQDAEFVYDLVIAEMGRRVLAQSWRLDLSKPLGDDNQPQWERGTLVGLPGSCSSVYDRKGKTSFEADTIHRVPINHAPGKLAVERCAYLQRECDVPGQYLAYVTGPLVNLEVFRPRRSNQAS